MTIKECLFFLQTELEKAKIENSTLEAELMIEYVLKIDKKDLILRINENIDKKIAPKIKSILNKRKKNYPWSYIKKEKYFYNLPFFVNKNVLTPRPESELIIDNIIQNKIEDTSIIDIGTGSGCLIISLAKCLENENNNNFYALDICQKALKIAKYNYSVNNIKKEIKFLKSNLLEKIIEINYDKKILKNKIIIIANLPYLTKEEISESPTIKFEPTKALDGGKNGIKFYQELLENIKTITKIKEEEKNKYQIDVYMEISSWQKKIMLEMIKEAFLENKYKSKIIKDLNKRDRLIKISL